jgi:hypothetical protein
LAFLLFVLLVVLTLPGPIASIRLWQAFRFVLSIGALSCIVINDSVFCVGLVIVEAYQEPDVLST